MAWLRHNGFDGAEICIAEPGKVDAGELTAQLKRYSLAVSTISTGQAWSLEGLSLTDKDARVRQLAVNRVKEHITLAARIGCPLITIGLLRGAGTKTERQGGLRLLRDAMEECAYYAGNYGVKLIIEPINRYETTLLNSAAETLRFISSLDFGENVGILFDTFHANIEEQDLGAAIKDMGDKLLHVHFADSNRWLPGMGRIDFAQVFAALQEIGLTAIYRLKH